MVNTFVANLVEILLELMLLSHFGRNPEISDPDELYILHTGNDIIETYMLTSSIPP